MNVFYVLKLAETVQKHSVKNPKSNNHDIYFKELPENVTSYKIDHLTQW